MPNTPPLPTVLVVEDEPLSAHALKAMLLQQGYAVALTDNGPDAIRLAKQLRPDVVIMDVRLRGQMDGLAASLRIQENQDIPVVFLSAYPETATQVGFAQPRAWLLKPVQAHHLDLAIRSALAGPNAREA